MGKQKERVVHQYMGVLMDSREEVWMAMWLEELKQVGYIKEWNKVTKSFKIFEPLQFSYVKTTELKTKIKRENKNFTLLQDLEYTPDFEVIWTDKAFGPLVSWMENGSFLNPYSWFFSAPGAFNKTFIEVKPVFDQHDKTAKFSILQKVLWNVKGIFVDLILPEKLFEGTFMPLEAMEDFKYKKAPTGKNKGVKKPGDWKTSYIPKTLKEFLNGK